MVVNVGVFRRRRRLRVASVPTGVPTDVPTPEPTGVSTHSVEGTVEEGMVEENVSSPQKNIVLVFPYRDRKEHYQKHMQHLNTLRRPEWNLTVYVVEQGNDKHFRRAWLLNIGIHEAHRQGFGPDTCVVTHDVDMLATARIDYAWCDRPTQICSELSCHGNSVPYHTSAGGVVEASMAHWETINGFTNTAHGWGGEDDDLHHRFRLNGLLDTSGALRRPKKGHGTCNCLHDEHHTTRVRHDDHYKKIGEKIGRMKRGSDEWKKDGLSNLRYHVVKTWTDAFGSRWFKVVDEAAHVPDVTLPVCSNPMSGNKWKAFSSMVHVLQDVNATYTLSSGSVLQWYRDCAMGADLDFNVDFDWFMNHIPRVHAALVDAGWKKKNVFGQRGQWGYEEAWVKNGITADLFTIARMEGGKYVNGLTAHGKTYPCYQFFERRTLHTWNSVSFLVPEPIDMYLNNKYGTTWNTHHHTVGYRWDVEPFKTENGRRHCVKEDMPEGFVKPKCCTPTHKRCVWTKTPPFTISACEKENLLVLLRWTKRTLADAKVPWWIFAGTLLGSVRGKGHIKHETDIDIAFQLEYKDDLQRILSSKVAHTHFHFVGAGTPMRLFFSKINTIHIDFWPVEVDTHTVKEIVAIKGRGFVQYTLNRSIVFPLQLCAYEDDMYPCPAQSERWVRMRYGKNWNVSMGKYSQNPAYGDGDGHMYGDVYNKSKTN